MGRQRLGACHADMQECSTPHRTPPNTAPHLNRQLQHQAPLQLGITVCVRGSERPLLPGHEARAHAVPVLLRTRAGGSAAVSLQLRCTLSVGHGPCLGRATGQALAGLSTA